MGLSIKVLESQNPFAKNVEQLFLEEFPNAINGDQKTILEAVTTAFISSSRVRYGPVPNPESLVAIRDVIRKSIAANHPIPILTPFGSRKSQLGAPLDIAEIASLKQLRCLQKRVKEYYKPGIIVNIRLEDTSGHYLFVDDGELSRQATDSYCQAFQKLVRILDLDFIKPVLESSLFNEAEYISTCHQIIPALEKYIVETDAYGLDKYESMESWKSLASLGWRGNIPLEQRDYYRNRYSNLYPGISDYDSTMKLVRYFAGSWARIRHNGTGADESWGNEYIRVTFVSPIPGAPSGLITRNIYYRTLPRDFSRIHIPAWRGKGYLKINSEVIPKLASWNEALEYENCSLIFSNRNESVEVRSDFVITD